MTPVLFLLAYFSGLLLTVVRHPIYGLYTYLFTFYMAPNQTWWSSSVPDLRYLFIAAVVTMLAILRLPSDQNRSNWYQTTPGRLLLLFVLYNWLQIQWAVDHNAQLDAAFLYTKHLIMFVIIYRLADSLDRIRDIAIVHVLGCAWFGYQAFDAGGGRLEKIGGAVAGANELGVHVTTGLIFGGILLLLLRGIRRWAIFAALPLIANTLVLTVSRGAFLGFFTAGVAGYLSIPKRHKKQYILLGVLGLVLVSILAHDDLIERFEATYIALTSDEQQLDHSAVSRLEITKAGIKIGLAHPFGAGDKGTEILSAPYITGWDHGRSAHNTFAGVFAEHGFPGLIVYVLIILWVLQTIWKMRKQPADDDTEQIRASALAIMAGVSLVGIYVSGNFSSNIDLETQYWCLALLLAACELRKQARQEAEVRASGSLTVPTGA